MSSPEQLQLRIYSPESPRTLIYLPGLHGDWTLVGSFRQALLQQAPQFGGVRFIEFTYPRTLDWTLDDYAAAIETALAAHGITSGWLLGESFGSQVVWPIVRNGRFKVESVILAGGFVRHPMRWAARLAERLTAGASMTLLTRILFTYARVARYRYRHSQVTLKGLHEFMARRTELDRDAATHRLHLLAANDPRPIARSTTIPVFGLSGVIDPIVPWFFVRPWLKRHCPALRDYHLIGRADHNVLGTAPDAAAAQALRWMTQANLPITERPPRTESRL
jgi:pimeloyl-ACP methyl ester carboxylesterase